MVHHGAVRDDLGPREGGHSPRNKMKTVGKGWSRAFRPVLALFLVWVVAAAGRAETPSPLPGTNRPVSRAAGPLVWDEPVPGGGSLRVTHHFDHNALIAAVPSPEGWIVLTSAGVLLRCGRDDFSLLGEKAGRSRGLCLAEGLDGEVLAGFADGRVCRVDPLTLELQEITRLPGRVIWLGATPPGGKGPRLRVAVTDGSSPCWFRPGTPPEQMGRQVERWRKENRRRMAVHILPKGPARVLSLLKGKEFSDSEPTTYFLDSRNRLWLGVDAGEFGGVCARLSLPDGRFRVVSNRCHGVLGFTEDAAGRVLAFGGLIHIVLSESFVARVDRDRWETLREFPASLPSAERETAPGGIEPPETPPDGGPAFPIDLMKWDEASGCFRVLASHEGFDVDAGFRSWRRRFDLEGRVLGIRRCSVGFTPQINALFSCPGKPEQLVFVSGRDGFFRVTNGLVERFMFSGQLETPPQREIQNVIQPGKSLFLRGGENALWLRGKTGWIPLPPTPSSPPAPLPECPDFPREWDQVRLLAIGEDFVRAAWLTSDGSGENALVEWRDGVVTETGRTSLCPPDLPSAIKVTLKGADWADLSLDPEDGGLVRLCGKSGKSNLVGERLVEQTGLVLDLVKESEVSALLVTENGLFRYDPVTDALTRVPVPEGPQDLRSACRDGKGRLWVAGRKLHLSADGGRSFRDAIDLPVLPWPEVSRLRPDPQDPEGVILTLFDRGVAFLKYAENR